MVELQNNYYPILSMKEQIRMVNLPSVIQQGCGRFLSKDTADAFYKITSSLITMNSNGQNKSIKM